MKTKTIFSLVGVLAVMLGLWGYIQANGEGITLCVRRSGSVSVEGFGFRSEGCRRGETEITLNGGGEQAGADLHLFDGDGQDLGILVDVKTSFQARPPFLPDDYAAFNPDLNAFLFFANVAPEPSLVSPLATFLYDGEDCTGTQFISFFFEERTFNPQTVYEDVALSPLLFKPVISEPLADRTAVSQTDPVLGCVATSTPKLIPNTLRMEEIFVPFTEPLAYPLEVKSQ